MFFLLKNEIAMLQKATNYATIQDPNNVFLTGPQINLMQGLTNAKMQTVDTLSKT